MPLPVMPGHCPMGCFRLYCLPIRTHQNGCHESERTCRGRSSNTCKLGLSNNIFKFAVLKDKIYLNLKI